MKRDILFRGRCENTDKWIYGYYIDYGMEYIKSIDANELIPVKPETIGQFTGEYGINPNVVAGDNKKMIFEGDKVIIIKGNAHYELFTVVYHAGGFMLKGKDRSIYFHELTLKELKTLRVEEE